MAADIRPFERGASKVWTIPPGTDFLGSLARELVQTFDLANHPDALADAIIYLPNRRSARAMTLALFDEMGGKGTLLPPDIRTLGDVETDEPPPVAEAALAALPPTLSEAQRLGVLAQLVSKFYASEYDRELPPASALSAARELSRLLEHATLGETPDPWHALGSLVEASDLAAHWANSVKFLSIIAEMWPAWLAGNNAGDPLAQRQRAADALATAWAQDPPKSPVIIAGSTGATPSGRLLMRAALALPKGLVVFPGLDTDLSPSALKSVSVSPSHPQFALVRTLNALQLSLRDIRQWPSDARTTGPSRRRLVYEALAPADDTADWRETLDTLAKTERTSPEGFARNALQGMSVIELPNEAAEAEAAALLLRGALEREGETGALVTPDAGLARRVGALLARWGISVPPSAGQPLGRTPAGSLISLCARWVVDPADPVTLSAVLKHPFAKERALANLLDLHFLRGARRWQTLEDLARGIEHRFEEEKYPAFTKEEAAHAAAFVRDLQSTLTDAGADFTQSDTINVADGAQRIAALAGAISETPLPWAGEDGAGASKLLERIREIGTYLGEVAPRELAELVETECASLTVSLGEPEHPRLAIWGPLEARLQSADLIVLAGLNEDVWPVKTPPEGFLPRRFRADLDMPDPDERLGLSAHDFAQLACAPRVVMLYASRRDDAPAVASRWVWRLRTLAQGSLFDQAPEVLKGEFRDLPSWVSQLQHEGIGTLDASFTAEPKPTRKPAAWPKRMSVTRIDRLQRDPYSIWAEDILGLKVLDPMNGPMQPNLKGTAVHRAIELLEEEGQQKSVEGLTSLLEEELRRAGDDDAAWLSRKAIWEDVSAWFLEWRSGRDVSGGMELEVNGELVYQIAGAPFELSAQADRIEIGATGQITIVDFKTGSAPSDKAIGSGFDQQMPLQALIASKGGFKKVRAAPVASLEYVEFRGKPGARTVGPGKEGELTPDKLAETAEEGVKRLIASYRADGAVFTSAPRVQFVKYDYGYNLLARRAEWTSDTNDGDGDD